LAIDRLINEINSNTIEV